MRELLEQFTDVTAHGGESLCNVILFPYQMNGAARGYTLLEPAQDQTRKMGWNMLKVFHVWSSWKCVFSHVWSLQSVEWAGWALPMGRDGALMPLALYAQDVLKMAASFLELAGLGQPRAAVRRLDSIAGVRPVQSLEERNRSILEASFFQGAFEEKREAHAASGTRYAITTNQFLRNVDFALVENLDVGFGQFLDFGEEPGQSAQSFWVSAEGFFYVLSFKPVAVSQKSFVTPIWMLQATWAVFLNNVSDDVAQAMQALRRFFSYFFRAKAWHLLKISSLFTTKLCIIIYVYTSSNNNIYMHNKDYILHIQYIQYIILNTYQYYIYILCTHIHIYIYISTYIYTYT